MIEFHGKTNKDYCWINVIQFQYPDGTIRTVDREQTQYTIDPDGELSMYWMDCYFWDGESAKYVTPEKAQELNKCKIVKIELDEDADPDYKVTIHRFKAY